MLHSVSTKEPKGYRRAVCPSCGSLYSVDHLIIWREKQSFILTKCVTWVVGGGEMQPAAEDSPLCQALGEKNSQDSRYPSICGPAFSSTHLKWAAYKLRENLGHSHPNDVFEFCGLNKDTLPPKEKSLVESHDAQFLILFCQKSVNF